mgnify:CR=1 FL=1
MVAAFSFDAHRVAGEDVVDGHGDGAGVGAKEAAHEDFTGQVVEVIGLDALEPRFEVSVVALQGQIGSGSLPIERLESAGLALAPRDRKAAGRSLDELAAALRALPVPVIGRITDDRLLLDLRCLEDSGLLRTQLPALRQALR